MKFKLDENLSPALAFILEGHDVETVISEGLGGSSDEDVFGACVREQRCLVTLDLDFADVTRFPPHRASGIAVLRSPRPITPAVLRLLIGNFAEALRRETIDRQLWIVESRRIRIHADTAPEPPEQER